MPVGAAPFEPARPGLKTPEQLTLPDVEALRLILRGDSVVDWHRLNFASPEQARAHLEAHGFEPDNPADLAYLQGARDEAVRYLKRTFGFAIPRSIAEASVERLLLTASGKGHKQLCACTVLKALHIINHMSGRELLFRLPVSDHDLYHLVEEKVYRTVGAMLAEGFPIAEFVGGRKNVDSTYTKLLSKAESTAAALYDKLRFRIVTKEVDDLMPVLHHLSTRLFAFNMVIPRESSNTVLNFRSWCATHPHLEGMVPHFQGAVDDVLSTGDNRFSAPTYRVIHFVVDMPVRVPAYVLELAPPGSSHLGPVVYVQCEFQLLDQASEQHNEAGDANHQAYKRRQRQAVISRLRLSATSKKRG